MRYAEYDPSAPQPAQVLGWYNHGHPTPPAEDRRIELTDEQWATRLMNPYVQAGALVTAPTAQARAPAVVTMRQARLALLQANLLGQVETAVLQAGLAAQITWEYAITVERDDTLTQTLATALGLTDAQLDTLFTTAASL